MAKKRARKKRPRKSTYGKAPRKQLSTTRRLPAKLIARRKKLRDNEHRAECAAASSMATSALSVVFNNSIGRELGVLRNQLTEARLVCPVLFAVEGDWFSHRIDERGSQEPHVNFEYLGRSQAGRSPCRVGLCMEEGETAGCGRGPTGHVTPAGWLKFRQVCRNHRGLGEHYGAIRGGFRDACDAWPASDHMAYGKNGEYDENVVCLPPEKCAGFRRYVERDESESGES